MANQKTDARKVARQRAVALGNPWRGSRAIGSQIAPGAPISKVMEQARHASFETTRGYIREADAFRGNAASYLGL
jgi:hypothetical protein